MSMLRNLFLWLGPLVGMAILLEAALRLALPNSRTIIGPLTAAVELIPLIVHEQLLSHLFHTVVRTATGFALACVIGIGVGMALGVIPALRRCAMPIVDLLRSLPSAAVIPILVLAAGSDERTYVTAIIFGGVWPVLINTSAAIGRPDRTIDLTIRQLPVSYWRKLTLRAAAAAPAVAAGMRVSLAICFILAITAEILVGRQDGVGFLMTMLENGGNYRGMYASVFALAIVGFAMNQLASAIEQLVPWVRYQYSGSA